ncbi:MAG: penicillin-binding protein [Actinomycetes bacterium]
MTRFALSSARAARPDMWSRVGLLVGVSAVAGLLVAGVALPVVGGLGMAAKRGAAQFDSLPSELKTPPLPQRTRILAADGSVIAQFYYENRISVPLTEVAPVMRQAIVAIEDSRFYQHSGVDLKGVVRALVTNSTSGSIRQGGSTITQQYVKNVLIEAATTNADKAAATADTLARKVREARYAIALEGELSKDQILERYLNIAYFGSDAYGIEAAARRYFDRHASQLTLPQAAMLAGLVRNPSAYDPINHPKAGKVRRDVVLERMRGLGYVTDADYARAVRTPVGLRPTTTRNACQDSGAPFFCDYVEKRFLADPALGRTQVDRLKLLLRGGLDIRTTLQPKMQQAAQKSVDQHVPRSSRFASVLAMVEPGTGYVRAIAENRDYGSDKKKGKHGAIQTNVDYATDQAYGGSTGFQSGSTFKVFTLTTALEQGLPLGLRIHAPNSIDYGSAGFHSCIGAPYTIHAVAHNAGDSEAGTYNIPQGLWRSVNTFFILLEARVGQCNVADTAERLGVRLANGHHLDHESPALTLGTNAVSPLDMANAYATFAAHGKYCPPTVITAVTDATGHHYAPTLPPCKQVVDQGIADTVTAVLEGVINGSDPLRTGRGLGIGRPSAGKTGTVTAFAGAWFIGFTPQLAAASMVVDPIKPQKDPLENVTIGGRHYGPIYGATLPGPIWQQAMTDAMKGLPVKSFPPPNQTVSAGKPVAVPDVRGMTVAQAQKILTDAGFVAQVAPQPVAAGGKPGTVARTSPPGGSKLFMGSSVTIYVTNGQPPPPPLPSGPPGQSPPPQPTHTPKPKPSKHGHPHH